MPDVVQHAGQQVRHVVCPVLALVAAAYQLPEQPAPEAQVVRVLKTDGQSVGGLLDGGVALIFPLPLKFASTSEHTLL